MRIFTALVAASLQLALSTSSSVSSDDPLLLHFPSLASWFRDNGGILDERLGLGVEKSMGIRGTIALAPIAAETLLLHCPSSLMIAKEDQCDNIALIEDELRKGDQSPWHVYLEMDDSLNSRIPTQWERDGRAIAELQGLPPTGKTHRHLEWFVPTCNGGRPIKDDVQMRALLMMMTRASDRGLVPIYDLLNHHNGLINTHLEVDDAGGLSIVASVDIEEGEGIYNTYARGGTEPEPDIFNQYGFVEDWPQVWTWEDLEWEDDRLQMSHIIVLFSPTVVALAPPNNILSMFGNNRRSLNDWVLRVDTHHARLHESIAAEIGESAEILLDSLPTTIEFDRDLLKSEKAMYERGGGKDVATGDVIKAIEYRLSFKMALRSAVQVARTGTFSTRDEDEL